MPAPPAVVDLVERFVRNEAEYLSAAYNEAQVRREFIDPFFDALGWDVTNREGYAEAYKDVVHEDSLSIAGSVKAPDYCFRVGGRRTFFLEAKKPSVHLKTDPAPAYQLRRYAWSGKLPLSVLTNFAEFVVYDCRVAPKPTDKPSVARTIYLTYREFVDRWDEIEALLSRSAVLKGAFDKYANDGRQRRGTTEVDVAFLKQIEDWRDALARNIAMRNADLDERQLNLAVQATIDRIVFLRMCEDRGIEPYGQLRDAGSGHGIYATMLGVFDRADAKYNSGLFHFKTERGREPPDLLTHALVVDDKVLKAILSSLYYPTSPYEFSALPADILGQVYEQFLGKVIRLDSAHRANVEEKPEVKKAGGVYYTPTFVVDYIVEQTVGRALKDASNAQASRLKIVDPSCGSGSFLIGAYQYLLDWYRDRYVADGPSKHTRELYQGRRGEWRLSTWERKRILLKNVYGVDIDPQAVEVTKLSLLLKVLEGESQETLSRQQRLFRDERALPDLDGNIKCGNSLIETDIAAQFDAPGTAAREHINAFDLKKEFPGVFPAGRGGFDIVIGNPPWGASFTEVELDYLRRHFARVIERMIDSYIYFIDRADSIACEGGRISYIIPSTLLNQVDAKPARKLLLERGVSAVASLGMDVFGKKPLNTSTIIVSEPRTDLQRVTVGDLAGLPLGARKRALRRCGSVTWREWRRVVSADPHLTFLVGDVEAASLLERLRKDFPSLAEMVVGDIQRGVSPDIAGAHVVDRPTARTEALEKELLRPSMSGPLIKRYQPAVADQLIVYTTKDTAIDRFPNVKRHLERFRGKNSCPEVKDRTHPWWSLHRPRNPVIFQSPKFIGLTTSKTIEVVFDADANIFVTDAMYVFQARPEYEPHALLAVLQSKLFLFLYRVSNQGESRVIPQVKATKLQTLPFPRHDRKPRIWDSLATLCQRLYELTASLASARSQHEQHQLTRSIEGVQHEVDKLAFELYGLTRGEAETVNRFFDAIVEGQPDEVRADAEA